MHEQNERAPDAPPKTLPALSDTTTILLLLGFCVLVAADAAVKLGLWLWAAPETTGRAVPYVDLIVGALLVAVFDVAKRLDITPVFALGAGTCLSLVSQFVNANAVPLVLLHGGFEAQQLVSTLVWVVFFAGTAVWLRASPILRESAVVLFLSQASSLLLQALSLGPHPAAQALGAGAEAAVLLAHAVLAGLLVSMMVVPKQKVD